MDRKTERLPYKITGKLFPRERQAKWDKQNLRTVSTHLSRREAGTLRLICRRNGTTPYALLQRYLRSYIAEELSRHGGG